MIREFKGKKPFIHENAIVDTDALVMGNVIVEKNASIWPHALLRADEYEIVVRENVAILDKAFIEAPKKVVIGKGSIVSHGAIIHGAEVDENVLVGIGAIILEVKVGKNSIIGAGSVVTKDVEENSFYAGVPAKKIRDITQEDLEMIKRVAIEVEEKKKFLMKENKKM